MCNYYLMDVHLNHEQYFVHFRYSRVASGLDNGVLRTIRRARLSQHDTVASLHIVAVPAVLLVDAVVSQDGHFILTGSCARVVGEGHNGQDGEDYLQRSNVSLNV